MLTSRYYISKESFPVCSALPLWKRRQAEKQLQKMPPGLRLRYLYVLWIESDFQIIFEEMDTLMERLLGARPLQDTEDPLGVYVVPRSGSESPWSSQVTDVCRHRCTDVRRVERGLIYELEQGRLQISQLQDQGSTVFWDVMVQSAWPSLDAALRSVRDSMSPRKGVVAELGVGDLDLRSLEDWSKRWGVELSAEQREELELYYSLADRNPTDAELMMYAQVNSEHCRHTIFRSWWGISGELMRRTLFGLIKRTSWNAMDSKVVLSAYKDNGAVIAGQEMEEFWVDIEDRFHHYGWRQQQRDVVLKVETHNHPTAVCPYPGAATGVGGEIRDEIAVGQGAEVRVGVCGYMVSHLRIPGFIMPWERPYLQHSYPSGIASSLEIMLDAPIGAARYGNEFGRALVCGIFRTLEYGEIPDGDGADEDGNANEEDHQSVMLRGYHKPVMIAGGVGSIARKHVRKRPIKHGDLIVVLGGPGMKIGMGGGSVSSAASGTTGQERDYASVQRDHAQMQRRAYEVIRTCNMLPEDMNPIKSIHDVGAGGLANAIPEIVESDGCGALIYLNDISIADQTMSAKEIWCNESQERFVLVLHQSLKTFEMLCWREQVPYALVGRVVSTPLCVVAARNELPQDAVNMPLSVLFKDTAKILSVWRSDVEDIKKEALSAENELRQPAAYHQASLEECVQRVLQMPSVGDKSFLITIADRSVGGLTYLEQMVGPWQVPVADAGITLDSYRGYAGTAVAMGERVGVACQDPAAASRLAAAEAVMNLLCTPVSDLNRVCFSANWQVDFARSEDQAPLYDAVKALSDWCVDLGIAVPVGKDSMSMRMAWKEQGGDRKDQGEDDVDVKENPRSVERSMVVSAPISCVITATSSLEDVRATVTPCLLDEPSFLLWVSLGRGQCRLGTTALAYAFNDMSDAVCDVDSEIFKEYVTFWQQLRAVDAVLAYHDVSDGGMFVSVCEMAFASRRSITISLDDLPFSVHEGLFGEEIGALIQVRWRMREVVPILLKETELFYRELALWPHELGPASDGGDVQPRLEVQQGQQTLLSYSLSELRRWWSALSFEMSSLRDDEQCAQEERAWREDTQPPSLYYHPGVSDQDIGPCKDPSSQPSVKVESRPKVAILRAQGVNGHREMAYAFHESGFEAVDMPMYELRNGGDAVLDHFQGVVACGGFSYADVLGAGRGWAEVIQVGGDLYREFARFFKRKDTFALGVCNGAQMFTWLRDLIPGAEDWPFFEPNRSQQFESRTVMVEVLPSKSLFWRDMEGMQLPVIVAHGEGRAMYRHHEPTSLPEHVGVRYVQAPGQVAQYYPHNPSGSTMAIAGFCNEDGRVSVMMPHPERCYRTATLSWQDPSWQEFSPWKRMFDSARAWVDEHSKR